MLFSEMNKELERLGNKFKDQFAQHFRKLEDKVTTSDLKQIKKYEDIEVLR